MKSRESLVRLRLFQVTEKRRQLSQLQMMMDEFQRMGNDLQLQIEAEEQKAGITDTEHFAYPTFASAARLRLDNIGESLRELRIRADALNIELEEANAELAKSQTLERRENKTRSTLEPAKPNVAVG